MADRAIKMVVLEGDFAALSNLGLPLSVSLHLQEVAIYCSVDCEVNQFITLFWPNESVTVGRL